LVEIALFEMGWVTERKFQGEGSNPPTNFGVRKLPGLSRGVVCVILRLAVLIQYRRVTQRDRHAIMAITRAEL